MNTKAHRSGMRRTMLSVCLAAALGSGSTFAAHTSGHPHDASTSSWGHLHRSNASAAAPDGGWRTHLSRVSTNLTTGGPTVVVTSCADAGPGTLREAAASTATYTHINMSGLTCPGATISLTTGPIVTAAPDAVLLGPGADKLTIDGGGSARVLESPHGNVQVIDLTLANGTSNEPGGCIVAFGSIWLSSSTISGCHVESDGSGTNGPYLGGGVAAMGDVGLYDSIVSGNEVSVSGADSGKGGGIYASGYVKAHGSRIEGNTVTTADGDARGGGASSLFGIYLHQSQVIGNTVTSTNGTAYGGGLHLNSDPPPPPLTGASETQSRTAGGGGGTPNDLIANQSVISGNTAHSETKWAYGGGIQTGISGGTAQGVQLTTSTISGNTASSACSNCFITGGGVTAFGAIKAYYSTISDNQVVSTESDTYGGGLYADHDVLLANSTLSGNRAQSSGTGTGFGGGIASFSGALTVSNSTIAFNEASTEGGGIYAGGDGQWSSTIVANNQAPNGADAFGVFKVTGDHNLVMAANAGVTLPADTLSVDPLLLPLHGNGGLTVTHALAVCSPAIDSGSNPQAFTQDQRGTPFSRSSGASADIGAFELQPDPDHIFGNGFDPDPCLL